MEITLSARQMEDLARKTAHIVAKLMKTQNQPSPDLVTTSEAAKILGIKPASLRQIVHHDPYRYPHIKRGDTKQAKLLFKRDALLPS